MDSVVPVEEPLFKATPPEIRFANFAAWSSAAIQRCSGKPSHSHNNLCVAQESLQNLDATLCLRNQDNVARRVCHPILQQ